MLEYHRPDLMDAIHNLNGICIIVKIFARGWLRIGFIVFKLL